MDNYHESDTPMVTQTHTELFLCSDTDVSEICPIDGICTNTVVEDNKSRINTAYVNVLAIGDVTGRV